MWGPFNTGFTVFDYETEGDCRKSVTFDKSNSIVTFDLAIITESFSLIDGITHVRRTEKARCP